MEERNVKETEKNVKLHLLKGFACIGVVLIHIVFPGSFGQIVLLVSEYAVPIFFMTAGFYAYGKDSSVIRRRLLKILKIFAVAYAVFFLYNIAGPAAKHQADVWLADHFRRETPVQYVCFCMVDFAVPLWYLIAMTEIYILWLILIKKGKEQRLVKMTPILFLLQVLLTTYCETLNLEWFWKTNFVTRGLPWFLLGYYLNAPEAETLRTVSEGALSLLAALGCALAVIPTAFDLPVRFNVIGYIPYAFGLFALTLKDPGKSTCKPMEFIGEKLSLYVYVLHVPVCAAVIYASRLLKIDTNSDLFLWCKPILAVIVTLLVSLIPYGLLKNGKRKVQ